MLILVATPWIPISAALAQVIDLTPLTEKIPIPRAMLREWRRAAVRVLGPDVIAEARAEGGRGPLPAGWVDASHLQLLCEGGQPPTVERDRALAAYVCWKEPTPEEARECFIGATRWGLGSGWPGHQLCYHQHPSCGGVETPANYYWCTDAEAGAQRTCPIDSSRASR